MSEADGTAPGHDAPLVGRLDPLTDDVVPWSGPRVVVVPHSAHCRGSVALLLPDAGVLLAGDLLSDVELPLLDLEAADPLGTYAAALDALEAVVRRWSVSVLVPGHGTPTDAAGLAARMAADRAYLAHLGGLVGSPPPADPRVADDAAGPADARCVDPEQQAHHERQLATLRAAR